MGPATRGDAPVAAAPVDVAQRRPARWGRQPSESRRPRRGGSSSAQRRPARWGRQPIVTGLGNAASYHAQRRPARWGRQPWIRSPGSIIRCDRSTKAGPVGPATRRQGSGVAARASTLNEGRPGGAGNPARVVAEGDQPPRRSTKAGPVGPATPVTRHCPTPQLAALNEGRPGGAGNPGTA